MAGLLAFCAWRMYYVFFVLFFFIFFCALNLLRCNNSVISLAAQQQPHFYCWLSERAHLCASLLFFWVISFPFEYLHIQFIIFSTVLFQSLGFISHSHRSSCSRSLFFCHAPTHFPSLPPSPSIPFDVMCCRLASKNQSA